MIEVSPQKAKTYDTESDGMWLTEAEKLIPWLFGFGADIGCGMRSPASVCVRVDVDKRVNPEILARGDKLPFKDGELDFISSMHSLEHMEEPIKTLKEWLRCVRKGGIIAIVHPDVDYTHPQKSYTSDEEMKLNPHNRHYFEHNLESFMIWIRNLMNPEIKIIDSGTACPNWSFYVIIKKQ
ncbi:MAG: class I SAM-dependent methyltransferase [Bacteroidales bacterium]